MGRQRLKSGVVEGLKEKLATYSDYLFIFLFLLMLASLTRNILKVVRVGQGIEKIEKRIE